MGYENKRPDDYSQRAAKGQAYNLAVLTALADGKGHDNVYITKQFLRHLQFAAILQKASTEQIASLLDNPKLVDLIKQIDETL
jgi:hypothetical protein